ncbi:MAG: glycoside hydrolase family 43 protein [Armatimonadota bacterium]
MPTKAFTYCNPIATEPVRDSFILRVDGIWYMTGTSEPFGPEPGQKHYTKLWSSPDLLHWKLERILLQQRPGEWYQRRFWAPEIFQYQGRFYLTVNCSRAEPSEEHGVLLAVANRITGPYKVLTTQAPWVLGNDGHMFADDDGKVYLFRSNIDAMQVDLNSLKIVDGPWPCIGPSNAPGFDGGKGVGIEGPGVIKRDGVYYLFYSSWGRGYEVGVATARNIKGPWTKQADNPIWGSQERGWCEMSGATFTQTDNNPFGQAGHGQPFIGPDGHYWICGHGIIPGQSPRLVIDPLDFKNGQVHAKMSWTEQTVRLR